MEEMTSRQRMLAAIGHQPVDRVPVAPFGLGRLDPAGEVAAELIEKTDPFILAPAGGNPFLGADPDISVVQDGPDTITVYHTPTGDLTRVFHRTEITGYTTQFPCRSAQDLDAFMAMPWKPAVVDVEPFLRRKAEIGQDGLVLVSIDNGICLPATMMSPEDTCLLWAEAPAFMRDVVAEASRRVEDFVRRASAQGVDAYRIIGGEYASEMLGPRAFSALITPFDTSLVSLIHECGGIAHYHNHGDVDRYLELLADLGIDSLDPLEVPPFGNVDLGDAIRRIGDRVCLVGGLDDMEVLETRTTDEVLSLARDTLRRTGTRSFMLGGTSSGIYIERAARHFIALVDVAREFAGYEVERSAT
ncbi:MAG: hypothetical protein HPY83_00045 [Anaerolineae bacterium]|nr:hypothetical protein [Anaerolineae bacterium]